MLVQIHLRTVKTKMKCRMMRRFIRIYTACNKYKYIYPMDRPWSVVSGWRVEAISFQRANSGTYVYINYVFYIAIVFV